MTAPLSDDQRDRLARVLMPGDRAYALAALAPVVAAMLAEARAEGTAEVRAALNVEMDRQKRIGVGNGGEFERAYLAFWEDVEYVIRAALADPEADQ